jgi:hypothetical protein
MSFHYNYNHKIMLMLLIFINPLKFDTLHYEFFWILIVFGNIDLHHLLWIVNNGLKSWHMAK